MNTHFTSAELTRRPSHTKLDEMPINIGDVVYLKPANGPTIRATVIFNAPINGTTTYTTERIQTAGDAPLTAPGQRIRFRHEHVHSIEPVRRAAKATH